MNFNAFIFIILFSTPILSQEISVDKTMDELHLKIEHTEEGEKLKWLDSLASYITADTNFESDSITKETVRLALELDSIGIATRQTANLIFYQNNRVGDPKAGNKIFMDFLETAKTSKDHRGLAKFFIEGGDSFYFLQQYPESITYYKLAEEHARKAGAKRLEGIAKLYMGGTYSFQGKFPESSQILHEASKMFEASNDTFHIMGAKNTLSILYSQNGFFEEAKKERTEAIKLAKLVGSNGHLTSFYFNAATDAQKQGLYQEEILSLKLAVLANEKVEQPDVHIPMIYGNMIASYTKIDSLKAAKALLDKLEKNAEKYTLGSNRTSYLYGLKYYHFAKGDYQQALDYGKELLDIRKTGDHWEEIKYAEEFLADTYEAMGDKSKAYEHFKSYYRIKDSITNIQKIKGLSYYQTLYETEKRDAKISAQSKDIALLDAKNEIQNQWMVFGGLSLLGVFSLIIMVRSRNGARRRQRMQEDFSQNLIRAQEEERTRVARELHDSVGQKLMLLTKKTKEQDDLEMEQLAHGTLGELRSIARGLHPATMEKLGLTAALESMINEVDANTDIFFTHEISNVDTLLTKEASLHLYRIVQEVLNNMVKHSQAKSATITVESNNKGIEAIIKDNGKGFEFSEKVNLGSSLGMKTLMERAKILKSQLKINSEPNKGTTILLVIPT